ncbi:MAG: HAD-IIB family hydrolase [Chloroflexota bacterium]
MRYAALACDYDGTLATEGKVSDAVVAGLDRVRKSGRSLILVTGRQLEDVLRLFPQLDLFAHVVAENGGVIYRPATRERRALGPKPPAEFLDLLRHKKVEPLSVGEVIVATWTPQETKVLEAVRALGLELQVTFNKGAVMVLPPGINKATGLSAALAELRLSRHNVVGIGDGENDHAFLSLCECAAATANALPMLKENADYVTQTRNGGGVGELIEKLVGDDLRELEPRLGRHDIPFAQRGNGEEVLLKARGQNMLIVGPSGGGKSTTVVGLLERLADRDLQVCLFDPEGDYEGLESVIELQVNQEKAGVEDAMQVLQKPYDSVAISLTGLLLEDRPRFFTRLLSRLQGLRVERGRPHWLVADEAHHLLPVEVGAGAQPPAQEISNMVLVTVDASMIAPGALAAMDVVVALGEHSAETMDSFARATGEAAPTAIPDDLDRDEAAIWFRRTAEPPFKARLIPARKMLSRHRQKYAAGSLGTDKSFYFRGPEGKLNLRAQNLQLFMQLADGVDDETWLYHLRQGDYSHWLREAVKDGDLAEEVERIERSPDGRARESRTRVRRAIEERYAPPAEGAG